MFHKLSQNEWDKIESKYLILLECKYITSLYIDFYLLLNNVHAICQIYIRFLRNRD